MKKLKVVTVVGTKTYWLAPTVCRHDCDRAVTAFADTAPGGTHPAGLGVKLST